MKVILKQNVRGVGQKYEVKNVSDGYANNFLIPKKLAEYASPEAVKKYETLKLRQAAEIEIREELTKKQIEILKGVKIVLSRKANDKGHLFEQVHPGDIAQALKEQAKIEIDEEYLVLPEHIKEIGEHSVFAEIGLPAQSGSNKGEFKVVVEAR